jgi:addiction module HigA family antidote
MDKLNNIHPGEILKEEFLEPLSITQYRIAKDIGVGQTAISEIIKGQRRLSIEMAVRLSKYLGTSVKFWINLQNDYDIEEITSQEDKFSFIKRHSVV